ncbi:insulin-like receptor, partial [Asbolus verrucosus]
IGLTNLQHIGRGAIKIDYCPQLCFGNTIDWKAIGASGLDYRKTTNDQVCKNKLCPNECRGHCWNTLHCQALPVLDKCHPQCIGCTKENSSWHCLSCKFFENDGECVEECPQSKVTNYYAMKCMKKEECRTMLNNTWWVFENKCVQSCPLKYERNERDENGCTPVGDNYQKHCNGTVIDTVSILEEMAACTHIDGSLDIRISETYLKPDLETNLGKIVSISGYLKIGRSSAVRSLEFLQNLTLIKGETLENQKYALFVFENQNLQRLWNFTDNFNLTIQRGTIAFHDNPQLCLSEIEKLANLTGIGNKSDIEMFKYSNGDKSACNPKDMNITITENNPTNVTLSWERLESEDNDTVIGYTVYYVEATRGNVTTFANNDACNVETWNSIFVRINSVQLKYLSPYTRYGYYIKAYSTTLDGVQTPIYYFTTASDDPSPPIDFIAQSKNETTIVLSWNSPLSINDYESLIEQRNYCLYPHTESEEDMEGQLKIKTNAATSNCSCLDQDDFRIFNKDNLCLALGGNCKSFLYNTETQTDDTSVQKVSIHKRTPVENVITISGTNQTFRQIVKTDIDMNMYEFTNLRHFSVYIFFLMACNEREGTREQCSAPEMVSQRTNRSETADIVDEFHIKVDGRNAYITWFEPQEINSLIVSYQVEHKRIDLEHAKATTECLTRRQYQQMNHRYQLFGLVPGRYSVRVRAVSLAGPGKLSERKYFEIAAPKTGIYWIYALVALVAFMIVTLAAYIGRYCYRKKYARQGRELALNAGPRVYNPPAMIVAPEEDFFGRYDASEEE